MARHTVKAMMTSTLMHPVGCGAAEFFELPDGVLGLAGVVPPAPPESPEVPYVAAAQLAPGELARAYRGTALGCVGLWFRD